MAKKVLRKFRPTSGPKTAFPTLNAEPEEVSRAVAEAEPVENYAAVFGNRPPSSQAFSTPGLLSLQKSVGNKAVARLLAQRQTVQREEAAPEEKELKGSLPNIEDEAHAVVKGPPDPSLKSDSTKAGTSHGGAGSVGSVSSGGANKKSGKTKIQVGDINFNYKPVEKPLDSFTDKLDKVNVTSMPMTLSQTGGKPSTAFGSESFDPAFINANYDRQVKTSGNIVKLDFTLQVNVPWGVNNGGATDVPAADNAIVTAEKQPGKKRRVFQQIAKDLKPAKNLDSWVAPRDIYWSQALCERHEKFHGTDDWGWMQGPGKQVIINYLNSQDVDETNLGPDLVTALTDGISTLQTANLQFYKGGNTDYYAYAGEKRAFGDGKAPYQQLSQAVKNQGMTLMPAQLVKEVGELLDAGHVGLVEWDKIKALTDKWPALLAGLKSNATIQTKMVDKVKDAIATKVANQPLVNAITRLYNSTVADKTDLAAKLKDTLSQTVNSKLVLPFDQTKVATIKSLTDMPMADVADIKAKAKDPIVALITELVGTKTKKVTPADLDTIKLLYECAASDKPGVKSACASLEKNFVMRGNRNKFKAIFA